VAASLLVAHPRILASGLRRVPGGSGDVCSVHDCIEHTWAWFLAPALVLAAIAVLADGELRPWVLDASSGQSWLNPGPDSWWYGGVVRRGGHGGVGPAVGASLAGLLGSAER
jgi:hypothetical protein